MKSKTARNSALYVGICGSGAAALIYEMVWSRALTNTIGSTVYSFTILLAAFMAGLAVGGYYGGVFAAKSKEPLKVFGFIQLGIGVFGGLTFYLINNFEPIYGQFFYQFRMSFAFFSVIQLVLVFLAMIVPTSLMGATFPVAVKAGALNMDEISRGAGNIYSINTWGAVAGVLAAGFFLIPIVGLTWANIIAACINLTVAMLAFFFTESRRLLVAPLLLAAIPFALLLSTPPTGMQFGFGAGDRYLSYADFKTRTSPWRSLFDRESQYGRVQVFAVGKDSSGTAALALVNGGRTEGGTGGDVTNQKMLAYLPLAIHKRPASLLNIGLGTGMTLTTAAEDKRLKDIDDVEINPTVTEAVKTFFFPKVFSDKRVREITDDARHYLLFAKRKYDVIISEPSYPTSKGEAHLYTREFYTLASKRMTGRGVFVQWVPRYLLTREDLAVAVKTMGAVFPNIYAWDVDVTGDVILIGLKDDRLLDGQEVSKLVAQKKDESLAGWRFSADYRDFDFIMKDPSVPINSDDLPRIEFASAYNKLTSAQRIKQTVNR